MANVYQVLFCEAPASPGLISSRIPCVFSSDQFSRSVMSDSLWPHGLQHARSPYPSPTPGVYSNSCPLSRWYHPIISSSVIPFSSSLQFFPASGSFPVSQFFTSGGQSIGVSASTSDITMNTQDWSPLGWTGWISLKSKGLSRVFSNTTVHSFSSKEQVFFNFMAVVTIFSDFGAQENKVCHCFHCFPIYLPWSDGTRCHA